MKLYSIKDLEQFSGIKAHTIRAWEKRYRLLEPSRTSTNIRYYDNDQLIKLLNVTTLLNYGWKISKISKLTKDELTSETEKWLSDYEDHTYEAQVNGLIQHMVDFNEPGFEKIFANSVIRIGLKETIIKVIYPFLYRVGMLWRINESSPAQEHFASNIIRRKLNSAVDGLMVNQKENGCFVLALPERENHEIGLLLANYIIRSNGNKVIYLGADVPLSNIVITAQQCNADYVFTMLITTRPEEFANEFLHDLCQALPTCQVLYSGVECNLKNVVKPKNGLWIKSVTTLETFL